MLNQKSFNLTLSYLFYLLPAALITGPFLSDLIVTILGIFFSSILLRIDYGLIITIISQNFFNILYISCCLIYMGRRYLFFFKVFNTLYKVSVIFFGNCIFIK